MVYYHVNQAQEYIQQLGFTEANNESQDFSVETRSATTTRSTTVDRHDHDR
jgi:N-acetylglutamate synthase-like GNAT family acetyltransferase